MLKQCFCFPVRHTCKGALNKTFFRVMNRHCISCCVREVYRVLKKVVLTFLKAIWREAFLCVFVVFFIASQQVVNGKLGKKRCLKAFLSNTFFNVWFSISTTYLENASRCYV